MDNHLACPPAENETMSGYTKNAAPNERNFPASAIAIFADLLNNHSRVGVLLSSPSIRTHSKLPRWHYPYQAVLSIRHRSRIKLPLENFLAKRIWNNSSFLFSVRTHV
jgi:hypothetical protein